MTEDMDSEPSELNDLNEVIKDFAPEIADIYDIREDESEEQQIKTGRLHENRILGIILNYYLQGKRKVTTSQVESEYKKFYKEIARSTISTYLNMLKKESTLYKERDGRVVYYIFFEEPPQKIKPFWFTRIFCIVPSYFMRASFFAKLYIDADSLINKIYTGKEKELIIKNFKFLVGLIVLLILKNRSTKCKLCQFSEQAIYNEMSEEMEMSIKDRSDVLPKDLLDHLIDTYSEIPIFGGSNIFEEKMENTITQELIKFADDYKKDLEFQIMVSSRRMDLRLKQKERKESQNQNEDLE